MATFTIYDRVAFDLDNFDLSELADGESYLATSTVFRVAYGGGAGDEFRGSGLQYDRNGYPTAGVVTAYDQIDNGYLLQISGMSIKAKDLGDAAKTSSTSDDRQVFIKALFGDDRFNGGAKGDHIQSYKGDDTLYGGEGRDTLEGGKGDDVFVFDTVITSKNVDVIDDFNWKADTIVLDHDIFSRAGDIGSPEKSAFHVGAKAHDGDDRIIYAKRSGELLYDPDGDGNAKAKVFAMVDHDLGITHKDFEII
ncbi:hypothetical protein [Hansschlegelia zhihuaiae]|uniref:Calcium-binding protein n=1 Tax=Hansschlegelia zhihuaiae TaxID=405005 RepID=A0A4Q0MPB9_9HYPH|nr:hypothetical protein [Hansschlegelia zhihuaiae]RXF75650.1 hypothetical protein EK403_02095 [Hansschlegelia zhihuaiae]